MDHPFEIPVQMFAAVLWLLLYKHVKYWFKVFSVTYLDLPLRREL
jgi:hypothetical protein